MDVSDPRWAEFGISDMSPTPREPDIYTVNFRHCSKQKTTRLPGESTPNVPRPDAVVRVRWFENKGTIVQFDQPEGGIEGFEQADFEAKALARVIKAVEEA